MVQSVGPVKGEISRAMQTEMFQTFQRFFETWLVPRLNPPHDKVFIPKCREPFSSPGQEAIMDGFKYERLQACQILPDRQVSHKLRIVPDCIFRIASAWLARPFHHPDKSGHAFAQAVDVIKVVHELYHTGVICWGDKPTDVELSEVHLSAS